MERANDADDVRGYGERGITGEGDLCCAVAGIYTIVHMAAVV